MADHVFEAAAQKVTSTAAGIIGAVVPVALAAGKRMPEVREIGVFSVSGVAGEIGFGVTAAGTGSATSVTVSNPFDGNGNTALVTNYATTNPSAPSVFMRRAQLQGVIGAGVIFTWLPGELFLWSGAASPLLIVWQISTAAVTYDLYCKVAE